MKYLNFSRDFEVCFEFESWKAISCLGFKMATKFGRAAPTDGAKMRLDPSTATAETNFYTF